MQYAASAAAFLMVGDASASIVYTDLDPDEVIGGEGAEITLDINGDGTDDFTFVIYNYAGTGTYIGVPFTFDIKIAGGEALNNNEFVGSVVTNSGYTNVYVPILAPGEGINADDNFAGGYGSLAIVGEISVYGIPYYSFEGGAWLDTEMQFLGFRLNIDKDYFYGWMRMSVNADATQLTLHDYAYESEANKSIFTGSTASEIDNNPLAETDIYAFGQNLVVNIPGTISTSIHLDVYDMEGKLMMQQSTASRENTFNCSGFAAGNYIIQISDQTLSYRKQVHLGN